VKAAYCTLGCKVNQYDTQAMRELMENAGYDTVDFEEEADVYIVNTCTVTATGDKKSRQMISRAHGRNPDAKIVVAGCYSQRSPEEVLALPGVSLVIGSKDRANIVGLLANLHEGRLNAVGSLMGEHEFEELVATREGRTRAHLKIQEGCDRYCTYCIIPYARGPLRSRTPENIRKNLLLLAEHGYKEVVMTGIHLMSYGKDMDWKVDLTDAIAQADGIDEIQRIRLGSLEPQLLTEKFVSALSSNPKICRQFHLSMQSGSDGVLKRMNRRYDTAVYERCVEMLREAMPGCAITTDVIAGFPGESEREFQETKEFIRRIKLARIHVFPYSRREGTAAYSMPNQIPNAEKSRRAGELIHIGAELEREYLQSFLGTVQEVLLEEPEQGLMSGYTDTYARVSVKGADEGMAGQMVKVLIKEAAEDRLLGQLVI
jgi:threonylcarbamoyladenosine tRNA methylthiotransferase MtaB